MRIPSILVLALALLFASACGDGGGPSEDSKGVIGISIMTSENPFFVELAEAARDEAEKNGCLK